MLEFDVYMDTSKGAWESKILVASFMTFTDASLFAKMSNRVCKQLGIPDIYRVYPEN